MQFFFRFLCFIVALILPVASGKEKVANQKRMPHILPCACTKASSISRTHRTAKELVVGEERSNAEKIV